HGLPNCDPGCVTSVAIHPRQPSIIYARAYNSILKSTDSGTTWFRLPQPIRNPNSLSYLVLDPFQPEHLFTSVTTHNYRSFDGGLTWTEITEPAPHPDDFCSS